MNGAGEALAAAGHGRGPAAVYFMNGGQRLRLHRAPRPRLEVTAALGGTGPSLPPPPRGCTPRGGMRGGWGWALSPPRGRCFPSPWVSAPSRVGAPQPCEAGRGRAGPAAPGGERASCAAAGLCPARGPAWLRSPPYRHGRPSAYVPQPACLAGDSYVKMPVKPAAAFPWGYAQRLGVFSGSF